MKLIHQFGYHILALLVCMVWATTFVCTKTLLLAGLEPSDIFVYRFTLAYLCVLMLSERITPMAIVGIFVITCGMIMLQRNK